MKVLLLLLALTFAAKDGERHTKSMACSSLARTRFDKDLVLFEEILKRSSKSYEKVSVKLMAEMIKSCVDQISLSDAQMLASNLDAEKTPELLALASFDVQKFKKPDANFALASDQLAINIDYIEKDALNEQKPASAPGDSPAGVLDLSNQSSVVQLGYLGGVVALVLGVIYIGQNKLSQNQPSRKERRAAQMAKKKNK